VIVYRLDRLSRSQRDTLYLIEEMFLPNQVEFISISETIDTSTPFGRAMIGVMSVFAQLERETITERLRSGRLKMIKDEGLWAGGSTTCPYGYTRLPRGELVVNEEECRHIVRIFEEYVVLKSYIKVQRKLEQEGFSPLREHRIMALLKNRLYLGEVSFAGEWFKGAHEPIISVELFNAAQKVNEHFKGRNLGKIKNNIFTGKLICGCCGENYISHTFKKKATNTTYYYMTCRRRKLPSLYDSKCFNRNIKRTTLQVEIFNRVMNLETSGEIELTTKKTRVDFTKHIEKINEKINKLMDLYIDNRLPKDVLDAKLEDFNIQKEKLLSQSQESEYEKNLMDNFIKNGIPNLFECDLDTQTAIIDLFVDKIIVKEDGLQVIWNQ
ncbi:MAG: recombinase family protein, partial [Turicibacter sanguinis]